MANSKAPPFTLYEYRASPFCVAIRIALNECQVSFTPREVDPEKARTAAFLKRSPFGRLPALVEHRPSGELSIFESPSILIFLAERFDKSPFAFSDLSSKAAAISWLSFLSTGFSDQLWRVLTENELTQPEDKRPGVLAKLYEDLEQTLGILDRHLARRAFLAGDYSIADTFATPLLDLLDKVKDLDMAAYPHVLSWRERLRSRESYKTAWPAAKASK